MTCHRITARQFAKRFNQLVGEWAADARLPARKVDASSSTRRILSGIALRPGDEIRIEGVPDGGETAAIDYIEMEREDSR